MVQNLILSVHLQENDCFTYHTKNTAKYLKKQPNHKKITINKSRVKKTPQQLLEFRNPN